MRPGGLHERDLSLRFNLLSDALVGALVRDRLVMASLPRVLELCMAGMIDDFPALRPHHRHAWHMFLVQLAHLATEGRDIPTDAEGWATALRDLSPGWRRDEPWHLVAPPGAPAFLQPPVPEGSDGGFRSEHVTPDEIDILVTSRRHESKPGRMRRAQPQDWAFALVAVQTMGGYEGKGAYGIARMNGGYGSRVFVGLRPEGGAGAHVRRDLLALREKRVAFRGSAQGFRKGGVRLLWLEPWDGATQVPMTRLHPAAIEVCRRLRLAGDGGRILALRASSAKARIATPDGFAGVTGDPWAPVECGEDRKILTITADGFDWRRLKDVLFGMPDGGRSYELPPLARPTDVDAPGSTLVCMALARGQSRTEGFHSRVVPLKDAAALRALREGTRERGRLRTLAREMAEDASRAVNRCLRIALHLLLQKEGEEVRFDNGFATTLVEGWVDRFHHRVDGPFLDLLFSAAASDAAAAATRMRWRATLRAACSDILFEATSEAPLGVAYLASTSLRARVFLAGALRKHLPPEVDERAAAIPAAAPAAVHLLERVTRAFRDRSLARDFVVRLSDIGDDTVGAQWDALRDSGMLDDWRAFGDDERGRLVTVAVIAVLLRARHNPAIPFGAALVRAGLTERRLAELLAAGPSELRSWLPRLARRLAAGNVEGNWRQPCRLLWFADRDQHAAERERAMINRTFFATLHREEQAAEEEVDGPEPVERNPMGSSDLPTPQNSPAASSLPEA
jgi:CRISPR system Cascade subunit CasA